MFTRFFSRSGRCFPGLHTKNYKKTAKSPRSGQDYPDLTEKQRKKASRKREKSRILRDSFSVFTRPPKRHKLPILWGKMETKNRNPVVELLVINIGN